MSVTKSHVALVDDVVDDLGGHGARRSPAAGRASRGVKPAGDDPAQPGVAGVVHGDHRAEELEERLGHVADVGALAGAEQLGLAAGVEDVRWRLRA